MASMSEEVWNWLEDAYRSKLKISDLLTSTFGATLESVQEIFGNELIQQYREKVSHISHFLSLSRPTFSLNVMFLAQGHLQAKFAHLLPK